MTFEQYYNFELEHFWRKVFRFYTTAQERDRIRADAAYKAQKVEKVQLVFNRLYMVPLRLDYAAQIALKQPKGDRIKLRDEVNLIMSEIDQ